MQALSDLLRLALQEGVLSRDDLWRTEPEVIAKLEADPCMKAYWSRYRRITGTCSGQMPPEDTYAVKIRAKKRCIDPLVRTDSGAKRLTELDESFAAQLRAFLQDEFDRYVWARFDLQS